MVPIGSPEVCIEVQCQPIVPPCRVEQSRPQPFQTSQTVDLKVATEPPIFEGTLT